MRRKHPFWLLSLFLSFLLLAAACGGDDGGGDSTATTAADEDVPKGGTLVVGAEQGFDTADWLDSSAGASWGTWALSVNTMPRAYDIVSSGGRWVYKPSSLLEGEAELKTDPKQVVTYKISDKAVWSDGQPITSTDFKYTWEQVTKGQSIYDRTGFKNIESIDDSDPKTAVVTYKEKYADWKGLFAYLYGILPSHLLNGKDRHAEMNDGYKFSGGPWMMESWNRDVDLTLVPNPKWWGTKPNLDKVVFKFITDTSAEFQAFKSSETLVIYPQPQPDVVEQIEAGLEGFNSEYKSETGSLEALWFNNGRPPFDDVKVRQAIGYAIDRDALVDRLFGPLGVKKATNTLTPNILKQFTDVNAWSIYKKDPEKVAELMTSAGWTKGSDGIWAKGGQKFTAVIKTTTGNKRRELTEQIVQQQLKEAGFNLTIENQKSSDLFGKQLPAGDFQVGLYAQVATSISPTNCTIMCSDNIPGPANDDSGQNWQRVNIPEIDPLLKTVDSNLDDDARAEAQKKADKIMAANNIALPLDPLPNIFLWSKRVVGPLSINPVAGPFWNMHLWGVKAS